MCMGCWPSSDIFSVFTFIRVPLTSFTSHLYEILTTHDNIEFVSLHASSYVYRFINIIMGVHFELSLVES